RELAISILMASTIMFPRLLLILLFLDRPLAEKLLLPMLLMTVVGTIVSVVLHHRNGNKGEPPPLKNPLNFMTALKFALVFAGVKLLMAYAGDRFGEAGTYVASVFSGLTNMDAITLSMSRLSNTPEALVLAANAIIIAAVANTFMKYLIVLFAGNKALKKDVGWGFAAIGIAGIAWFVMTAVI